MKYSFPKIDLHLHLDGAIAPCTLFELAKERNIPLPAGSPEELKPFVVVNPDCRSVNEYLEKFDLPTKVLQDEAALKTVARELVERLINQGVTYAEIRFAPQHHTHKGISQKDAIEAVLAGIREGTHKKEIDIGLILCAMSFGNAEINKDANLETVRLAAEMRSAGVDAVDLAGSEGLCPLSDFSYVFDLAKELGLNYTCHAGDSQNSETVKTAIFDFGSRRIGHGHRIYDDLELCAAAIEKGVTLEICLTSNIHCQSQASYEAHPAKKLLTMGLSVCLNTDNPIISGVTLDSEYDVAVSKAGFTEKDLIIMNINSVNASFMPIAKKEVLIKKLKSCH